jgi:hypothetical protein
MDAFSPHFSWDAIVSGIKAQAHSLALDQPKDLAKYIVAAAAGWLLKFVRDRWRTRHARRFWRPFLSADLRVVVGRFDSKEFLAFEQSGLMGCGDAYALAELQRYLGQIGASQIQTVFAGHDYDAGVLQHTLISLGGPDANAVTRELVKKIDSSMKFGDPRINEIAIRDTTSNRSYAPDNLDEDGSGTDYGLILRVPSPYIPGKEVMIMAGSFGQGTLAAVRYLSSQEFLKLPVSKKEGTLECLVKTDVVRGSPQAVRPLIVRRNDKSTHSATG